MQRKYIFNIQKHKISNFFLLNKKESIREAIVKGSFFNVLSRGFGYLRLLAIAILIGYTEKTDVFFLAFSLIGIFYIFANVFDAVGVPNLVRAASVSREKFHKLVGLLTSLTLFTSILIVILAFLSFPIIRFIPFGYVGNVNLLILLKKYYYILIPYLWFSFWFHHFGAILRAERHFTCYYIGLSIFAFVSTMVTILGLFFLKDELILPVSLSCGQFIATCYMLLLVRRHLRFEFYWNSQVKRIINQLLLLLIVFSIFHLFIVVDRGFASTLPVKTITALTFGLTIAELPKNILKLDQTLITPLSEKGASIKQVNYFLKQTLKLSIPPCLMIFILSPFIMPILFKHGSFSHIDTELTVLSTQLYSLIMPCMILWPIFYVIFQVLNKLLILIGISLLAVIVNLVMNYLLVLKLNFGIYGLIGSTGFAYLILCIFSYWNILRLAKMEA